MSLHSNICLTIQVFAMWVIYSNHIQIGGTWRVLISGTKIRILISKLQAPFIVSCENLTPCVLCAFSSDRYLVEWKMNSVILKCK